MVTTPRESHTMSGPPSLASRQILNAVQKYDDAPYKAYGARTERAIRL